jgi:hypothetical protein
MSVQVFTGFYRTGPSWHLLGAGEKAWLVAIAPEGAELEFVPTTQKAIDEEDEAAWASEAPLRHAEGWA